MANSAFNHSPSITIPGAGNSTNDAIVLWNGTAGDNFSNSTIIVGATTMGLAADTNLLTFSSGTLTIDGTLAATTVTASGVVTGNTLAGTVSTATQNSITTMTGLTTVGTVGTGVWNGTAVITTYGGTGLTSHTAGDMLYYASGTTLTRIAKGTADQVLTMNDGATAPQWETLSAGGDFTNGGDNGALVLGTNDSNTLTFETNNTARMIIDTSGKTMVQITNTGGGEMFECRNLSNNAGAASVQIFSLVDAGDNVVRHAQFRVHKDSNNSGALHTRFDWYQAHNGSENMTMRQFATGVLSVDLGGSGSGAQVDVFDTYDDPIEIQRYAHSVAEAPTIAGITLEQRDANRERMVELGILYEKDTGSGYMMNIQPLTRLLAGGIYQNRFRMDKYHTQHEERLHQLENQMKALMDGKDNL